MKLRTKKGQIRLTETIAVLFIFFILVLFGIIFYYKYQQVSLIDQQEELLASRAMDTTLRTLFLPELICSKGEAESEDNCFDLMKLRSVNEIFKEHLLDYYFNIFSYSRITVQEIYPENANYTLYDKPVPDKEDGSKGWTKLEPTYFIISLRDETMGGANAHYGFGYLKVEVYS